ncbi:hypothetical protein HPP92_026741 [Vanilla planifolia]|uniref:Uncharacterized protein n=1 Tax=Vanilla planifolia TaxID=51239 RepID=A0A835PBY0_VANPL|nr:hypothetical protein HPP92_026741 [Vanilla planifolia]
MMKGKKANKRRNCNLNERGRQRYNRYRAGHGSCSGNRREVGPYAVAHISIPSSFQLVDKLKAITWKLKKIAEDDPRRIRHSLKVGLALTVASISTTSTPFFSGLGASTMWAVLTVVVVMDYTAGATLSKGLNRAFATLLAGAVGVGAHRLAALAGEEWKPVFLSLFVFLLGKLNNTNYYYTGCELPVKQLIWVWYCSGHGDVFQVRTGDKAPRGGVGLQGGGTDTIGAPEAFDSGHWCGCLSRYLHFRLSGVGRKDLHNLVASNLDKQAAFLKFSNFDEGIHKPFSTVDNGT